MKKQPQVTEMTRKNLINSFWNLYKDENINKITVKKICDGANYDRTTFYRYFNNISEILKEIEDNTISRIKNGIVFKKNNDNSSYISYDGFEEFNERYGEYISIFNRNSNINFYKKFKNLIKNDVYNYFKFNITDCNMKEFIFEFVFSSLLISYVYWYDNQNTMNLKSFVNFSNKMISTGIDIILNNKVQ